MHKIFDLINQKSRDYKSLPFWSLNDKLDNGELVYQIQEMCDKGSGGYFMHARSGCVTEYLSEDWFDNISVCVEKGEALGMDSYVYDENGWPSGFADGRVVAQNPGFCLKWLEMKVTGEPDKLQGVLGLYKIINGDIERIKEYSGGEVYAVLAKTCPEYIDILDKNAVMSFINIVYEEYRKRYGSRIKGFFTDEPQFGRRTCPWSSCLESEFLKEYGYNIIDKLLCLFIDSKSSYKVRYDFYQLTGRLMKESYYKQIFDFCEKYGYIFTGHGFDENSLYGQAMNSGDIMSMYEYMHMPGIDWLGREQYPMFIPKQAYSAASQMGRKRVLSEMFALCSWSAGPKKLKSIAERQYAGGVSVLCQHLFSYSLRGQRKRDYPPSHFIQQAWWEKYKKFNDYFTKLGCLLSNCDDEPELLVISPVKSMFMLMTDKRTGITETYDKSYETLIENLEKNHIRYDIGSEEIIKNHTVTENGLFKVGLKKYSEVLLPGCLSLDGQTVNYLKEFVKQGGKVYYTGSFPEYISGERNEKLSEFEKKCIRVTNEKELSKNDRGAFYSLYGGEKLITAERHFENSRILFITNGYNEKSEITLNIKEGYKAEKIDFENDTVLPAGQKNNKLSITVEEYGSALFIISEGKTEKINNEIINVGKKIVKCDVDNALWDLSVTDNILTLDRGEYSADGAPYEKMDDVRLLFEKLMAARKNCPLSLKYQIDIDAVPSRLYFAGESLEDKRIYINGKEVQNAREGYLIDKAFVKVNILPFIKKGRNEIRVDTDFKQTDNIYHVYNDDVMETEKNKLILMSELEHSYIAGDFAVYDETAEYEEGLIKSGGFFRIKELPEKINPKELTKNGFLFFAGKAAFLNTVTVRNKEPDCEYILDLETTADLVEIHINGILASEKYEGQNSFIITKYLKEGQNKISVKLYSGLRNMLGPHHSVLKDPGHIGPSSFTNTPGWCDPKMPLWVSNYYFIPFGFLL